MDANTACQLPAASVKCQIYISHRKLFFVFSNPIQCFINLFGSSRKVNGIGSCRTNHLIHINYCDLRHGLLFIFFWCRISIGNLPFIIERLLFSWRNALDINSCIDHKTIDQIYRLLLGNFNRKRLNKILDIICIQRGKHLKICHFWLQTLQIRNPFIGIRSSFVKISCFIHIGLVNKEVSSND